MYEMATQEIKVTFKMGPKTYSRLLHRMKTEEIGQAELFRRALDLYFHHLDTRELQLVSLMQAHADSLQEG
jgi:hypothetical protein